MNNKDLNPKDVLFCQLYSMLGNPKEAAIASGFKPEQALLGSAQVMAKKKAKELYDKSYESQKSWALTGLSRLAFGSINDVVALITGEVPEAEALAAMDLFSVSEVKKNKDGSLDIKLYDRFKALQAILSHESSGNKEDVSFYQAIANSALKQQQKVDTDES